ncbi:MAG: twin-arginine translocation pathway signal protein, partial [Xanthomonadaceae bacterium]|nr:twin-arginine translocation pathway signal protein [Xanthomonadaceae bacterium]
MRLDAMFLKKLRALTAAALATALLAPAQVMAQKDVTVWRVQSHWPAASSSFTDSLVFLKNRLEERTGGRLKLELYEANTLFSATDSFNAVRRGVIQMATISPAYIIDQVPLAGVASGLPF